MDASFADHAMIPYAGIIRIRYKGRRFTFLSACCTSSPLLNLLVLYASFSENTSPCFCLFFFPAAGGEGKPPPEELLTAKHFPVKEGFV